MDRTTDVATRDPAVDEVVPPVVAVMVTCNPGWWMEDCLESLAQQDYPALSVLVIDADSAEDPTGRVATVLPTAFVRRVHRRRGFGLAANEVLSVVEGASHFVFCHDDVILTPSAVRLMVEEAYRSNAGMVAPKLVGWHHPDRLLAVGMGMDSFGRPVPIVERGDLDQEQHDAVRDVFYVPSPCALIRADLFSTLGGFDPAGGIVGEDLDLAWRAHLAGARVVSAPSAVVRHLEATEMGRRAVDGELRATDADDEAVEPLRLFRPAPHLDEAEDDEWVWNDPDATIAPARHSRRARREAERLRPPDEWMAEDGWDDAWGGRRPRRHARPVEPPNAEQYGPEHETLEALRSVARLRAMIVNAGITRLVIRVPFLLFLSLCNAGVVATRDGLARGREVLHPWSVVIGESGALRKRRHGVRRARAVSDRDVTELQVRGSGPLAATLRAARPRAGPRQVARGTVAAWVVAVAVLLVGSRHIITGHLPLLGQFAPWPSLSTLVASAGSGWRTTGLGVAGPAPTLFRGAAIAGAVFFGHTAAVQHVLLFAMVPLGAFGVYRLARPLESTRAQVIALGAYLAVPLPYNALARGQWGGLVAYAATPWVVAMLMRAAAWLPTHTGTRPGLSPARRIVAVAVVAALAGSVQPGFLAAVVVLGVGLVVGGALTDDRRGGVRALALAVAGAVSALALFFPWVISWLPPSGEWAMVTGPPTARAALSVPALLRFQTGPFGAGILGYALLVAAAVPLIIGRSWRADWAVRMWSVAIVALLAAWAGQHGALGAVWPPAEVLLAPAAVALAMAVALGMAAFDTDLAGYTFGWRQAVAGVGAAAVVLAWLPILAGAWDGRWQQRTTGFDAQFSWMAAKRTTGDFRVLWVGAPEVLPVAGWPVTDGLAYGTSRNGTPTLIDSWLGTSHGTGRLLAQAIELIRRGDTAQAGHLLAPMGVRYVVTVEALAPLDTNRRDVRPLPPDLTSGMSSQLDLFPIDRSPQATVYENAAWFPTRAPVSDQVARVAALDDPRSARSVDVTRAAPALTHQSGPTSFSGDVPAGPLFVGEAPSGHWQLSVAGHSAPRQPAFASANLFTVPTAGHGHLSYRVPIGWRLADLMGILLWLGALWLVITGRFIPADGPRSSRHYRS